MKSYFVFLLSVLASTITAQSLPRIQVSANGRFLQTADGKPFFWMADTAWELFHRCNREEVEMYFKKRAEQGFNVVHAVALAELDGLQDPNPYGQIPFQNLDSNKPNIAYWEHIDWTIRKAADYGIYIALLPTWGDKLFKDRWGTGPEIFHEGNAYTYGQWIGNRYRDFTNVIWVLGGDRNPRKDSDDVKIWNQMAEGVAAGAGGEEQSLITFHPQPSAPGGSSNWFHEESWLDFNMHQTGHCPNKPTYKIIAHDYALSPTKPVLDGEPLYEDHPNCFRAKELGHSVPEDIRRIMYWNVMAGACGQSYGCHAVWQMYKEARQPVNLPLRPWPVALDLPMANQVKYLKNLLLSRPYFNRVPAQDLILTPQSEDDHYVIASRDSQGSYAFVYFPTGRPTEINTGLLSGKKLKLTWYDVRTGASFSAGMIKKQEKQMFTSPSQGRGNDWVLILDASR